jgi:hypothetical protein
VGLVAGLGNLVRSPFSFRFRVVPVNYQSAQWTCRGTGNSRPTRVIICVLLRLNGHGTNFDGSLGKQQVSEHLELQERLD